MGSGSADYSPQINQSLARSNLPKSNLSQAYSGGLEGSFPSILQALANTQNLGNSFIRRRGTDAAPTSPSNPSNPMQPHGPGYFPPGRRSGNFYPNGDPGSIPVPNPTNPNGPPIGGIPRLPVNPGPILTMPGGNPNPGAPGSNPPNPGDPVSGQPFGPNPAQPNSPNILSQPTGPFYLPNPEGGNIQYNNYQDYTNAGGGMVNSYDPTGGINSGIPPVNPAPGTFGNNPGGYNQQSNPNKPFGGTFGTPPQNGQSGTGMYSGLQWDDPNNVFNPANFDYNDQSQSWSPSSFGSGQGFGGQGGDNGLYIDPLQYSGDLNFSDLNLDPLGGYNSATDPYFQGVSQALNNKFTRDNADLTESFLGRGTGRGTPAAYAQAVNRAQQMPELAAALGNVQQQQIGNRLAGAQNTNASILGRESARAGNSQFNAGQGNQGNLALAGLNQGSIESQIGRQLQSLMTLFGGGLGLAGAGIPGGSANVSIGNNQPSGGGFGSALGGLGSLLAGIGAL